MPHPKRIDRERLGAQALAIIEEEGWDGWSLRTVASRLGVSANALYRHVDGRDGLGVAIAEAAAQALRMELGAIDGEGAERLVRAAFAYVTFACERPEAFSAFVHAKPPPDHPRIGVWFALWGELFREFTVLLPQSAASACFAYWALVHGRAELARGPARLAAPTAGLEDAVLALLVGYRQMGSVPSPLPDHVPQTVETGPSS